MNFVSSVVSRFLSFDSMHMRLRLGMGQCFVHNFLSFADDRIQVALILEALRINLVNVLGAGGSRGEPAVGSHYLEAADRRTITRSASKSLFNPLARQTRCCNCLRR